MNAKARHNNNNNALNERRLADIVHALKNPLAGVRGALQIACARLPPSAEREILHSAMARLADVDAMLDQLAPADPSHSGTHALGLGTQNELPAEPKRGKR